MTERRLSLLMGLVSAVGALVPRVAAAQDGAAEVLLRISPADTEVTVDGKPVELAEQGQVALARVRPGRHVLVVKKEGHVTLRKILDVPAEGVEGKVHLAALLTQVIVRMKSGRTIDGALISRDGDRITITRGRGKLTLRKGQYESLSLTGQTPAGKSSFQTQPKVPRDAAPPLPEGTLAEQVAEVRRRCEAGQQLLEKTAEVYGKTSTEARQSEKRQEALSQQAADLAQRIKPEIERAEKFHNSLIAGGRAADSPVVRGAAEELSSKQALLASLAAYLPESERGPAVSADALRDLKKAFVFPTDKTDQYGNPVVRRKGRKAGPKTSLPYEIWLKEPRMEFVLVLPGEFLMGSAAKPEDLAQRYGVKAEYCEREHPQHCVKITKPFYLGKYEITQTQWEQVMRGKPWSGKDNVQENPRHAAAYISWGDCQAFLNKVNGTAAGAGLGLPTEAQWEHACRAGTTSEFSFGDDKALLKEYAWYNETASSTGEKYAHGVGLKRPNGLGLYDMCGNVFEWCQDWYGSYSRDAQTDPRGPNSGSSRVYRGGGFNCTAGYSRSAFRIRGDPGSRHFVLGFRPSRPLP